MNRLSWLAVPGVAVAALLGGRWIVASQQAQARQFQFKTETEKAQLKLAEASTEQGRREYVPEVISMGVTLDKYRQGKLWDALQTGNAYGTIRVQDPKKYPWGSTDKLGTSGGCSGDSLENDAGYPVHANGHWRDGKLSRRRRERCDQFARSERGQHHFHHAAIG